MMNNKKRVENFKKISEKLKKEREGILDKS